MENIYLNQFFDFIQLASQNQTYKKAIIQAQHLYNIKSANIDQLTPAKIIELYQNLIKKCFIHKQIKENSWMENQLRIFTWILVNYVYIHKKDILALNQEDWQFFTRIFHKTNALHFEFQSLSFLKLKNNYSKWEIRQVELLQKIINSKEQKNKWNVVARDLFILSNKKYYKTPKQCRERWLNYLDPQKKKQSWCLHQDLILLQTVLNKGKRWSLIVKYLKNGRTQHNVKNRFKGIISKELNLINKSGELQQEEILKEIIYRYKIDLEQSIGEQKKYKQLVQFQKLYPYNQKNNKNQLKNKNPQQQKYNQTNQQEKLHDSFFIMSQESLHFQINYHSGKKQIIKNQDEDFDHVFKEIQQKYLTQSPKQSTQFAINQNFSEFEEEIKQFLE